MFAKTKSSKLELKKDKTIKKEDYKDKQEYKFDKNTDIIPKKKQQLLCVFFSEDRGAYFLFRAFSEKEKSFRFKHGLYIMDNEAIHVTRNGSRVAFYLEGISTPIKMSNIDKEIVEFNYIDLYGEKKYSKVTKIKGLKFDSNILDTFCNEKFAEIFTKQPIDNFQFWIIILCAATLVSTIVTSILVYVFR